MESLCYEHWYETENFDAGTENPTASSIVDGESETSTRDGGGVAAQCTINFLQLLSSTFFGYLTLIILVYRRCCVRKKLSGPDVQSSPVNHELFRYHVPIWLLQLSLTILVSVLFGEALIIHLSTGPDYITTHLYFRLLSPLSFIMCVAVLSILFHLAESSKSPQYLWLNIITLLITSALAVASLHIHLKLGLSLLHVKVIVETFSALMSVTLAGLLALSFLHEVKNRKNAPSTNLKDVMYLHYYSTLLSRLTFYWFTAILWLGYKRPLEEEDLGDLPKEEHSRFQLARFQTVYDAEKVKVENSPIPQEFSLWKCLFKTLWVSLVIGGVFRLAADLAGFVAPLGIRTIVEYIGKNSTIEESYAIVDQLTVSEFLSNGYIMAIVVLLSGILQSTFSQCSTFLVNSEGIHIKIALQALVYKKALTLSPTKASQQSESSQNKSDESDEDSGDQSMQSSSGFDSGSIVNIMSEDTNNVMMFFWMAHFIWAIPLKLAILMVLLYLQLGYSALIGAGICILIMIPLQFLIGKKMSSNSKELMERCDERLRSVSEILQGMKLLKLHGWELIFTKQVSEIREKEMKNLDRDLLYRSIMTFLTHISSVLVTVVTFGLYPYIESEKLEPSKVFAGLALFNQLTVPLFIFPITVPVVIDALVSTRRVREFLLMPEATSQLTKDDTDDQPQDDDNGGSGVATGNGGLKEKSARISSSATVDSNSLVIPSSKNKMGDIQASTDSVFAKIEEEDEEDDDVDGDADADDDNILDVEGKILNSTAVTQTSVPLSNNSVSDDIGKKPLKNDKNANLRELIDTSVVAIHTGHFSWEEDRHDQTLRDIFTQIPQGKLTIIVGSIGSGKTSLVSAILGEMRVVTGEVKWRSETKIAYAAQRPWILNASVRDNILFGKTYMPRRYKKVIEACALNQDIEILPDKDLTEIGEKGINLSGGQKQRVAIARALYSNANVVILDDPLSALDVEVAHHVFHTGIIKFLIRHRRAVVLVTHHLPVLLHAHHIIAMDKGQIRIQGTLAEIESQDAEIYAEWKEIMTKKEAELEEVMETKKNAKGLWSLVKNVSKFGLQLKNLQSQASWKKKNDEGKAALEAYRKRKGTFSHFRNLSHDIFLPSDDYNDEMMTPLYRRRCVSRTSRESRTSASSSKHPLLTRMSSLQVETETKARSSPMGGKKFTRMQSLPVEEEGDISGCPEGTRGRSGTFDTNTGQRLWKRFKNAKKALSATKPLNSIGSSATELEKLPLPPPPAQRLISTTSAVSSDVEVPEDDGDGAEESLLNREHSQDEREYGTIPMAVYQSYIAACGTVLSFVYLFFSIGYEVVRVYTNFWLKEWSDEVHKSTDEEYDDVMSHYFNIYVILSIVTVIVSLLSNLIGKQAGANSREILHSKMLNRIVRCPMRFFDSTPIGRIINRFSSDIAVVDRKLCISMQRFLQFVFLCVSAIIVNAIVNPWFLVVVLPVVAIYYFIQRFYRFSSRELQRIEAISRGPIYSHFHESLEGLSTIRAYKEQRRFTNQMLTKIDMNNRASMFMNVGNRWLSISLDYLGSVIVFLATLVSMVSSHLYPDVVTPSMVGLAINYTLLVPVYLNWVVKFLAEVEMFMNSVERIDRYAELDIEDYGSGSEDGGSSDGSLPKDWPSNGEVLFENVSVQYGPDRPLIITNLNVSVTPKQKVGLCGRSGSGKSSLLMALFRMSDVAHGKIQIDGIDIHSIPLLRLRSSLSIIPQENILFSGTIRFNLDPEGKVADPDIWRALELSQMKDTIDEMPGQLYADVKDGGSNFSAGQKQLLGLARAILHKSKLIIMDEATSSVDLQTERTLLQVVKEVFKESTVLTIAHRLDTIVDGDRVLVLDNGQLVEDGVPSKLIQQTNSQFASMVRSSNEQNQLS